MDKQPLTRQQINQFKKRFIWLVLFIAASLMLLFSCSVQESLLEHNPKDYKVLGYEYPWAEVLIMPDSIIEYRYSTEPLAVGCYGISKCRRVKK